MINFLSSFNFTQIEWLLLFLGAILIGANKTGLVSLSLLAIPIFASIFGGKASSGIVLPILILADIFAVFSFRKGVKWKEFLGLMPWAICGILIALLIGNFVSDKLFKLLMACAVFIVLIFLVYKEISGRNFSLKSHWYTNAAIGLLGGFSTMIGNAAGPIMTVYFLSIDLDKDEFVATRAWFFWVINLIKLPLHIFVWQTVSIRSFCFDLLLIPAIVIGGLIGLLLVKRLPEKPYRIFVIVATLVSSIFLII
ncbi:MAG: sulfite exporter TauE/SafE family protein [Spirochaetales bacterium]|nr:sulfite exporter TauE/SafE family protein [Spirochaetales bacterium]